MFAASAAFETGPRRERSLVSGARRMNIKTVIEYTVSTAKKYSCSLYSGCFLTAARA